MINLGHKKIYISIVSGLGLMGLAPVNSLAAPAAGGVSISLLPFPSASLVPADSLGGDAVNGTNVSIVGGVNTNIRSQGNTTVTVDSEENGSGSFVVIDKGGAGVDGQWSFDAENGFTSRPRTTLGSSTMTHTATDGLNVSGTTGNAGNITASGRVQGGTLNVTGVSTTNGITNTGGISTTTTLNVGTDATISRDATVGRNLQVNGNATTNGNTRTLGNTRTATLNVDTDATISRDTTVGRNLQVNGNATTNGNTRTLGNTRTATLNVDTDATISRDTTVGRNLQVNGNATTNGNTRTLGNTRTATLNVDTDATISRDTTVGRNLQVNGNATTNGNTRTLGNTRTATLNVDTDATISRDTTVGRNLVVNGATTTSGITNNGTLTNNGHIQTNSLRAGSGANQANVTPTEVSGIHSSVGKKVDWKFSDEGFVVESGDNTIGGKRNTTVLDMNKSENVIANGANVTRRTQNSEEQYDEVSGGGNVASRTQTRFGQTDRAAVGGNSATRAQTAFTQNDEIIDAAGNSNRLASTVGATTRTIAGVGGTTTVSQDNRDWIASTGVGAGSARVAVRNSGGAGNSTAELSVTNSAGNTHGVFVGENSTRISGGTNSTSLAFDDNGAHFRNDATGGPARVTGVADGVADFDAVNFRQLNNLDKKLTGKINETGAVAAAFAQLGQAQTPGKSTFGIAAGGQGSKAGVALGFSHRPVTMKPVVIKASLGASGKTVAGGVGATWEF
ncbi:YadA-like family protein [Thiothrix unzii]|uniref:YadA family autotransporter adhesin n=1 Tax=Thiothrix unzii TaxID=111769 RepID=UPI002A364670|nr:YadA-like family protein [Thiothrix unzii]MDX9989213.1 YadA-like family protein [Thiothrix unzii]